MDKRKILIIDDDQGFSEMVKLNLESTDKFEVQIQTDSTEGLTDALRFKPDVILLDVIMAKKEGPDIAAEARKDPRLKDVPMIFLTATVTCEEVNEGGGKIGGHLFVAKPSSLNVLLGAIEKSIIGV